MVSFNHWLSSIKPIRCQGIKRWLTLTMPRATGPRSLGTESVSRLTLKPWMSRCACAILFTSRSDLTRHDSRIEAFAALESGPAVQFVIAIHQCNAHAPCVGLRIRFQVYDCKSQTTKGNTLLQEIKAP